MNKQDIANAKLKAQADKQATVKKFRDLNYALAISLLTGRINTQVVSFAEMIVQSHNKEGLGKETIKNSVEKK